MKNLFRIIGITAFAVIIGFSMTACGDEEPTVPPHDPYKLQVQVSLQGTVFEESANTGKIVVIFDNGAGESDTGLTVDNLSWLTVDSFSISTSSSARTVSITGIDNKTQFNKGRVDVTLNVTRSAVPGTSITATVAVTGGGGYTINMLDGRSYFNY